MHQTSVHSTIVPDAVAIIAVCTTSRALAEFAVALKMVSVDGLSLPPGAEHIEAKIRIAQNVTSLEWRVEARAVLRDPDVEELAWYFHQICRKWVPTNSIDPITDDAWLSGVRALYSRELPIQQIANALLEGLGIREALGETPAVVVDAQPAAVVANKPAAVATAPTANASPPAAPPSPPSPIQAVVAPSPQDTRSMVLARLQLLAKAKRFVDQFMLHYNALQARKAAAQASAAPSTTIPAPETPQVSAVPPIETSPPDVEAVATTAPIPPPSPPIALTIQAPQRPDAHQAAGLPVSARHRAVRRSQPLLQSSRATLSFSPTIIPFRRFSARESFVNPHHLPKQQSLYPP